MRKNHKQAKQPNDGTKISRSPIDVAMRYLGYSARSVREVERYLDDRQYGEVEVMEAVDRLIELGLLNDHAYAEEFVQSRLRTKPVSRRHLREQLLTHEVPKEIIEEALAFVTDDVEAENALQVVRKYADQLQELPTDERARRITQRALSRGFAYPTVRSAMEQIDLTASEEEDGETEE